jgi:uncharacterized membrane protein
MHYRQAIDNAVNFGYVASVLPVLFFHQMSLIRAMHPRKTYGFILGGTILWCALVVLAPALAAWEMAPAGPSSIFYRLFDPICHQLDTRSFHLFGFPFAVCSRCTSIYFAFLAGTLLYPLIYDLRRPTLPPRVLMVVALVPMVFDAGAGFLGLYEDTFLIRTVTGALFGLVLPLFVVPAAIEGASQLFGTQLQKGTPDA